jgi:hypothetical protein
VPAGPGRSRAHRHGATVFARQFQVEHDASHRGHTHTQAMLRLQLRGYFRERCIGVLLDQAVHVR